MPPTKRKYLDELVTGKNRSLPPLSAEEKAAGFQGWHHRGYLPHCDYPGLVQFVTIRLADSLPLACRAEWEPLLALECEREKRAKLEEFLDRGYGECHLRDSHVAQIAENAFLHFHSERYGLVAWCVMPNHAHVLVHIWNVPLSKIVRSWKQFIATKAEAIFTERRPPARLEGESSMIEPGRRPALRVQRLRWQREYWDTYMRGEKQERTAVKYIENNPVKALLCRTLEDWTFSSARLRDSYERLVLPSTPESQIGGVR